MSSIPDEPLKSVVERSLAKFKKGVTLDQLAHQLKVSPKSVRVEIEKLREEQKVSFFFNLIFLRADFEAISVQFLEVLNALHVKHPNQPYISSEKVLEMLKLHWRGMALTQILKHFVGKGYIRRQGYLVAISNFKIQLNSRQRELLDRVVTCLNEKGKSGASSKAISLLLQLPVKVVEGIITLGVHTEEIIRLNDSNYVSAIIVRDSPQCDSV